MMKAWERSVKNKKIFLSGVRQNGRINLNDLINTTNSFGIMCSI